jgi:hypothetical protein
MERSEVPENSNKFIEKREREREIIKGAIASCDEEMQNKCLYVPIEKQRERTTYYTGVSIANVKSTRKISKEIQTTNKKHLGRKGKFHIQVFYLRK